MQYVFYFSKTNRRKRLFNYQTKKTNRKIYNKKIRTKKRGVENYFPKQVGYSPDGLNAATDEAFIALVEKYIADYLDVMKDWK